MVSRDSWMYPYQRIRIGNPYISNKYHGYTVRGTTNCPDNRRPDDLLDLSMEVGHGFWRLPRSLVFGNMSNVTYHATLVFV